MEGVFQLIEAIQANMTEVLIGVGVALPILILTRKWSVQLLQFLLEVIVYSGIMHLLVAGVVRLIVWFKGASTGKAGAYGTREPPPAWTTPLVDFWSYELYNPRWILYLEIAFVLLFVFIVWRYRPMQIQQSRNRKFDHTGKRIKDGQSRGGVPGKAPPPWAKGAASGKSSGRRGRRR